MPTAPTCPVSHTRATQSFRRVNSRSRFPEIMSSLVDSSSTIEPFLEARSISYDLILTYHETLFKFINEITNRPAAKGGWDSGQNIPIRFAMQGALPLPNPPGVSGVPPGYVLRETPPRPQGDTVPWTPVSGSKGQGPYAGGKGQSPWAVKQQPHSKRLFFPSPKANFQTTSFRHHGYWSGRMPVTF